MPRFSTGPGQLPGRSSSVFDHLAAEVRERKLRAGDTVFLVIESHVLKLGPQGSLVLGADAEINKTTVETSVPAQAISERLEEVASEGCLVVLLLDGIHDQMPVQLRSPFITEWVRDLTKRGVIVLLASKQDPSERLSRERCVRAGGPRLGDGRRTPREAGKPGRSDVADSGRFPGRRREPSERTDQTQAVRGFFPPEYLNWSDIRIFEPQPAPWENVAKR